MRIPVSVVVLAFLAGSCALFSPDYALKHGDAALNRNDYVAAVSDFQTALQNADTRIAGAASLGLCRAEYQAALDGKQIGDAFGGSIGRLREKPLQLSNEWVPVLTACASAQERGQAVPTEINNFLCQRDFDLEIQEFHNSSVNLRTDYLAKSQWCARADMQVRDELYAKLRSVISLEIEKCKSNSCNAWELNELVDRYAELPGADLRQAAQWRGEKPASGQDPLTLEPARARKVQKDFGAVVSACYKMIEDPGLSYPE